MRFSKSDNDVSVKDSNSDVESINCCQLNVHKARTREFRSRYHNHPEKRLFHKRSCTDVLFLLVFVGCVTGWIYLGLIVIRSTPPEALFAPTDSNSKRCGFDSGVENRPYVLYFDLQKCFPPRGSALHCDTPRVCVSECPQRDFHIKVYHYGNNFEWLKSRLICQDGFNKNLVYDIGTAYDAVRRNNCAEYYLNSRPIFRRCLFSRFEMYSPRYIESYLNASALNDTLLTDAHVASDLVLSYVLRLITNKSSVQQRCLPKDLELIKNEFLFKNKVDGKEVHYASKAMMKSITFGHAVFKDLTMIWQWLILFICLAAMVSFAYITIMRWLAGLMVWLSVFASIGLLLLSSYYTFIKFKEFSEYESMDANLQAHGGFDPLELLWRKETWLSFFIISVAFLLVILVTVVFLRNRIILAIELIKEGSKAVTSSWSAVIFPVFPWMIQVAIVAFAVVIFAYLMNSGISVKRVVGLRESTDCVCKNNYEEGSLCDEKIFKKHCYSLETNRPCVTARCAYSEKDTQKQNVYLHLYNAFMLLWSLFFASGFGQMVLASTFASYYWTFNKDDLPIFMVAAGVGRVIRYHLGTVSLGSFLLALCNWIRILLEVCYNRLNKYDNGLVKVIKCCCSCVFWCLNNFLKFLNKNAYIMCAIHGKGFCTSAKLAFHLLVRNILKVAILDRVTNFLFFLGKVMVTAALGLLSFYFFSRPVPPIHDPLRGEVYVVEYYFVPIVIVCIVTYFISSLFFGVYSMAVDTLFLCALEDLETNDGSPEKPYFMSKNLMKILKRKNEIKVK